MAFIAVFVASIVALIRPLPKVWLGSRKRALGGLGVSFLLFVLTGIVIPPPEGIEQKKEIAQEKAPPSKTVAKAVEQTKSGLGISIGEFSDRFNKHSAALERPWRIENIKIQGGSFSYLFNDYIAINGSINSDGELVNILVFGSGDGTAMSGLDVFSVMTASYAAAMADDDMKDAGKAMLDLFEQFKEHGKASKIRNNIKVTYSRSDVVGSFLGIESVS